MRVQDVMSEGVQTIAPTSSADDAWELMRKHDFHHVVVTRGSRVVGLLSHRDAGGRQGATVRKGRTVEELMTSPAVTIEPTATVRKAANLMRGRSIGCVVVTDRGRVVGIVTVADLLELIGRGINRPVTATRRWTLKHRAPHRKRHAATGAW
ncbi:MAG: HPP family protein [Vicinamibacterales bacterium]